MRTAPVAILGAGLAGLTAAQTLRKKNIPVLVYESGKRIAGLATTFREDGFVHDFGAHFITNRLAGAIGVLDSCRDVHYYGESVFLGGRYHSYPFGLLMSPRFALSAVAGRIWSHSRPQNADSLAKYFVGTYGKALADSVAIPLVEAWSGSPADELAASVADKLPLGLPRIMFLKIVSRIVGRAIAIGYGREKPESVRVWHVYPEGGLSELCEKLASGFQDAIQLESPAESIIVESGRVVAIRVNGKEQEVSAVVSTVPCTILAKLIQGTSTLKYLYKFRFRPMVFANMRFVGRNLLPDVVIWTPEKRFPFFRLTETPISMPWLAPDGKTQITVDIGCDSGDEIWKMTDANVGEFCLQNLAPLIPDARRRYLGCRVLRTPIAYPVFRKEYENDRKHFQESTGIDGLYSIGRNGEFDHLLTEDVYWRTLTKMEKLVAYLENPVKAPRAALALAVGSN